MFSRKLSLICAELAADGSGEGRQAALKRLQKIGTAVAWCKLTLLPINAQRRVANAFLKHMIALEIMSSYCPRSLATLLLVAYWNDRRNLTCWSITYLRMIRKLLAEDTAPLGWQSTRSRGPL